MANKAFTPAELASNIAFQTAKKASPKVSTTPAPLQSLLKPQLQQPQAISSNNIPWVWLPQVNNPIKTAVETPKVPAILPTTGAETNKTLSKDKVVEIINNAPAGADKKAIVNKLIERGYTLEWYGAGKPSTVQDKSALATAWAVAWAIWTAIPILSWIGDVAKYAGKKIYQTTLNPTQQEAEAIQSYRAWTSNIKPRLATETALDLPILNPSQGRSITSKFWWFWTRSMIGEQAEAGASDLWQTKVQPLLNKAKTTVNVQGAIKELKSNLERMAKQDPDKLKEYQQAFEELTTAYADPKYANMSLKDLQDLKSWLQQRTPAKFFKWWWVELTDAYRELRGQLSSKLAWKLHSALSKDYWAESAKLYKDYANLQWLSEIWPKALTEWGRKWWFGGFIDFVTNTLATPITSTTGKALYKWGNLLKMPQKLVNLWLKAAVNSWWKLVKSLVKGWKVFSLFEDGSLIPWSPTNLVAPVNPITYNEKDFIKIKWLWGMQVQKDKLKFNKSLGKKVVETDLWYIDENWNVMN